MVSQENLVDNQNPTIVVHKDFDAYMKIISQSCKIFKPKYCSEKKSYYHKTIHKNKYLHNHNQMHFTLQAKNGCATCQNICSQPQNDIILN